MVMQFVDGNNYSPLFGFADLFAGVGRAYSEYLKNQDFTLGRNLYDMVRSIFSRTPRAGFCTELERGVYSDNRGRRS
jgi:hypothetical protein